MSARWRSSRSRAAANASGATAASWVASSRTALAESAPNVTFERGQSLIKTGNATGELSQAVIALIRWSGSGRGPSLGGGVTLRGPRCRRLRRGLPVGGRGGAAAVQWPGPSRGAALPDRPGRHGAGSPHGGDNPGYAVGQVGIGG